MLLAPLDCGAGTLTHVGSVDGCSAAFEASDDFELPEMTKRNVSNFHNEAPARKKAQTKQSLKRDKISTFLKDLTANTLRYNSVYLVKI